MKIKILLASSIFLLLSSFQANAGDTMTSDQIKKLIAGKTVHSKQIIKGFDFKVYFTADGKVTREWKGKIQEGTYSFDGNKHCINLGQGDQCGTIVSNGDGTYKRLKNGKRHVIDWLKFEEGKHI